MIPVGAGDLARYLTAIVEASEQAIVGYDLDGLITVWNHAAQELFGYAASETTGRSIGILQPVDARDCSAILERIRHGETVNCAAAMLRHKDGHDIGVSLNVAPIRDTTGRVIGAYQTARCLAKASQAEQNQLLAAIVNSSNNAITGVDRQLNVTSWNPAAERIFGYAASDILGRPISLLAMPGVSNDMPATIARIFKGETVSHFETIRRHKDGRPIPVSLSVSPLRDAQGEIVGLSASLADISERKSAEQLLQIANAELSSRAAALEAEIVERKRAEERFRLLVESSPIALIMLETGGRIALINSQTEKMFGYERGELIGQTIEMLLPARFRDEHVRHRGSYALTPERRAMGGGASDLFGLRKDGVELSLEIGLSPIAGPDGAFVLASVVDVSARKEAENKIKRSLQEKVTLLQEVHHRVKNNLQLICSLLSLQAGLLGEQRTVAQLREIERRVMSMALIHEQLYHHDDLSSIDLAEYVRNLTPYLVSACRKDDSVTLRLESTPTILNIEQSIPCGLILNELLTNAFKHAYPEGKGEILVRVLSAGDQVTISVADHGVGMDPAFDWQSSRSLGMTLVRILTEQLDGRLEIETKAGSSFAVHFTKLPVNVSAKARLALV